MWECSQANPQLLFDVGLEISASWQRLLAGVCVQPGQTFPRCKPAEISRIQSSFEDFHLLQVLCLEWSGWELLGSAGGRECKPPIDLSLVPWSWSHGSLSLVRNGRNGKPQGPGDGQRPAAPIGTAGTGCAYRGCNKCFCPDAQLHQLCRWEKSLPWPFPTAPAFLK